MQETFLKLTTLIAFAGITGLAAAALHQPRGADHSRQEQDLSFTGSSTEDIATFSDDWRKSMHDAIRTQVRENLISSTRIAVQDAAVRGRLAAAPPQQEGARAGMNGAEHASAPDQGLAQASLEPRQRP